MREGAESANWRVRGNQERSSRFVQDSTFATTKLIRAIVTPQSLISLLGGGLNEFEGIQTYESVTY